MTRPLIIVSTVQRSPHYVLAGCLALGTFLLFAATLNRDCALV